MGVPWKGRGKQALLLWVLALGLWVNAGTGLAAAAPLGSVDTSFMSGPFVEAFGFDLDFVALAVDAIFIQTAPQTPPGGGGPPAGAPGMGFTPGLPDVGTTLHGTQPLVCVRIELRRWYAPALSPTSDAPTHWALDPESILMRIGDREYRAGDPGLSYDDEKICVNCRVAGQTLPLGRVRVYLRAGVLDPVTGERAPERDALGVWFFEVVEGDDDGTTYTYHYSSGWAMVSLPLASTLEFDEIASPLLWQWNPAAGRYDAVKDLGGLEPTRGYWLRVPEGGTTAEAKGNPVTGDVGLELGVAGWHMISVPWTYERAAIRLVRGDEELKWSEAVAAGWVASSLWSYDLAAREYKSAGGLDPWLGYWLRARIDDLTVRLVYNERGLASTGGLAPMVLPAGAAVPPPMPQASDMRALLQVGNHPNPVTGAHTTTFRVTGPLSAYVDEIRAAVYDLGGRTVWQGSSAGAELLWHTDGVANGTYLYEVQVKMHGEWTSIGVQRLLILR